MVQERTASTTAHRDMPRQRAHDLQQLAELAPVLRGGELQLAPDQAHEKARNLVAERRRDGLDGGVAGLQQLLGRLEPYRLDGLNRREAGGLLDAPHQRPLRQPDEPGKGLLTHLMPVDQVDTHQREPPPAMFRSWHSGAAPSARCRCARMRVCDSLGQRLAGGPVGGGRLAHEQPRLSRQEGTGTGRGAPLWRRGRPSTITPQLHTAQCSRSLRP